MATAPIAEAEPWADPALTAPPLTPIGPTRWSEFEVSAGFRVRCRAAGRCRGSPQGERIEGRQPRPGSRPRRLSDPRSGTGGGTSRPTPSQGTAPPPLAGALVRASGTTGADRDRGTAAIRSGGSRGACAGAAGCVRSEGLCRPGQNQYAAEEHGIGREQRGNLTVLRNDGAGDGQHGGDQSRGDRIRLIAKP